MIIKNEGFQNDIEKVCDLYEECKDIIHGYLGFNTSKEAGELISKISEIRDVACDKIQECNKININ